MWIECGKVNPLALFFYSIDWLVFLDPRSFCTCILFFAKMCSRAGLEEYPQLPPWPPVHACGSRRGLMLQNIKRIAHAIASHVLCFPTLLHKFLDSCLSILWAFELQQRLISRRLPNVLWPNVWGSKQYVNAQLFIWTFQFNLLLCFFTRNNVLIILWWTQLKNTLKSMTFINTEVFFSRNICFVWLWNTSLFCFTHLHGAWFCFRQNKHHRSAGAPFANEYSCSRSH